MERKTRGVVLAGILAWLVLYPLALTLLGSVRGDQGWTATFLASFVTEAQEWTALWNSIWISLSSVVLAGLVGVPLAFVFERLEFPGRRVLGALVALPAVLPPLVGVIAFEFLYGASGFIPRSLVALFDLERSPWQLRGWAAILLVHAYSMYVYFYLFARAGLAKVDVSMLEAAQSLGHGNRSTLLRVTLPLLRPQVGAAALLTFMTALGSFSAPYIFGGGFRVMTTQIVMSKLNGDLAIATVETAALAVVALVALVLLRKAVGTASVAGVGKGTPPASKVLRQPLARWSAAVIGWTFAILLLLPHVTLIVVSFVPVGTWTTQLVPPTFTLGNYGSLVAEPERLRPLVNSLWMATAATVGAVGLAVWAGRLVVQRRVSWRSVIETLTTVPWAVPGTVLAMALATTFSIQAPWVGRLLLVGTIAILPLAYMVRNIPVVAGAVLAGFRQLDPSLDEAAASLGAGRWRRVGRDGAELAASRYRCSVRHCSRVVHSRLPLRWVTSSSRLSSTPTRHARSLSRSCPLSGSSISGLPRPTASY